MRLLVLLPSLVCLLATPVLAKRHAGKAAGVARGVIHHDHFVGGGTGGDSPKPDGGSGPELLFTFDDGPHLTNTPKVLDLLEQHGYKAVFFVCGAHFQGKSAAAEKGRELLREIVKRGHAVGNHTIHHLFLCNKANESKIAEEVEGNGKLIAEALGAPPYLFRTPYGAHCPTLNAMLASLGVRPIGWDIDPQDWRLKNAPKIEASVKKSIHDLTGRAILLMHDVQPATIVALPKILDYIDAENKRRVKIGQPPIKVLDYDYLLEGRAPKKPPIDPLVAAAIEIAAPIAKWLGVTLPNPSATPPSNPPPTP